ncbi:MAG: branched-chain amino acid aminotransferase [Candidatus Pacebacteria bacterium]|nr:branched-chain amino acid aminotransferase [Candidatus Paceibacterota bacterium]
MPADCHIQYRWSNGEWDDGKLVTEPYLHLHIAATALHYGQAAFEGLKAFECKDGAVRLFRPAMNVRRLNCTATRVCMPSLPEELFLNAVKRVIQANRDYVPPYGTGGSLYIRPLMFGSGPRIGVQPAAEYVFLILVLPVGPYYKGGLQPVRAIVLDDYDRAAPHGMGSVKVAGNYAASLKPHKDAHDKGFSIELYLDAKEHRYIEEFSTSNFVAITNDKHYVTPESPSILPSVTNNSLQQIAGSMGLTVERRPVLFDEVAEFCEVGACGTAVVVTPVNEIVRGDTTLRVGPPEGCGPVLQELYREVTAIQYGEEPDRYGWLVDVD